MASLQMNSAYPLDGTTISQKIMDKTPGNYALGRKNNEGEFLVSYVGRSDSDVKDRLQYWAANSDHPLFKFSYASSANEAYEKECRNYHDFTPPENDIHPDKPKNSRVRCPICGE